jgi:ubiquinone/menaquinone biosynthesis C-methylase UbiE
VTDIHWAAAQGFSAAADVYERARPSYPQEAVDWLAERLGIGPGRDVLDLAAGTGKLTRLLEPLGARVIAVEPVAEMRVRLVEAAPSVDALDGTAEAIPLADGSVDAVTCAQAFHWFRHEQALREIHRVLRPEGALALVWNVRDPDDPLQAQIAEILEPFQNRVARFGDHAWREALDASRLFGRLVTRTWHHEQRSSVDMLVERFASVSIVAALPEEERAALLDEIRHAASAYEEPIRVPYVTEVSVADRLTAAPAS